MFLVSVVIRNRNEESHLRRVLTRLRAQRTPPLEIIVVDNASTDGSRAAAEEAGATCVHVPREQFTYGRATNLGIQAARGELVLMLSAHSLPVGRCFIDDVIAPFDDAHVAAVRIPIAANTTELVNADTLAPLDRNSSAKEIFGRGPAASGSVIRRSVWQRFPVDETLEAAEDKEWALRVLRAGGWTMPVANACYVYAKTYTREAWLSKLAREERAGFQSAGIQRDANWQHVVKTILAGGRDLWNTARTESALYRLRRRH
jgi:glycosyltransferase involved in cell wall biosynthesis